MNRLLEIISENDKLSSMRVMLMSILVVLLGDWIHAIVTGGARPDYNLIALVIGSGIVKTVSKKYEK